MNDPDTRSILLIPPHADFTLTWPPPEGFEGVDAARGFAMRALAPGRLAAQAHALAGGGALAGGEAARALLLLRASLALLPAWSDLDAYLRPAEPRFPDWHDVHRHLRTCGAALAGLSAPPSPIRLQLDDLELPDGTTRSSADVLRAAALPGAPYEEDLESAVRACEGAVRIRLRLDRDQQLPAAVVLAQRLQGRHRLEVTGPFASAHWEVLSRLPPLAGMALVQDEAEPDASARGPRIEGSPLLWLLRGKPPAAEAGLLWVDDPYRLRRPRGGPWAGAVPFASLAEPERLEGCKVLVLGFCALGDEGVVGADGSVMAPAAFKAAVERLRGAGVRLVGEWWIGAPGIGEDALERTLAVLEQDPPFDSLAGVRAFHWPAKRESGRWGGVDVVAGPLPEGHDLARARPFSAPGTLASQGVAEKLQAFASRLSRRAPLSPGRMAQAYVTPPSPHPPPGEKLCLDPDCAVVELPASLDGKPGPAFYAANLRTGLVMAVDPRLAPSLQRLRVPARPEQALPKVPEAQRAKLVRALVEKAVLREVRG